jgi:hypothetical protein
MMYRLVIIEGEISVLYHANKGLSKRRRAKKIRLQLRGTLTIQEAQDVLNQRAIDEQIMQENQRGSGRNETGLRKMRGCNRCGKTGHNIHTC